LQFLLNDLAFFDESSCPLVLGLCFEPVGGSGDALQLLGVLFGLVVFLVRLYALLDDVHGSYIILMENSIIDVLEGSIIIYCKVGVGSGYNFSIINL
jgi:hypothetical protein